MCVCVCVCDTDRFRPGSQIDISAFFAPFFGIFDVSKRTCSQNQCLLPMVLLSICVPPSFCFVFVFVLLFFKGGGRGGEGGGELGGRFLCNLQCVNNNFCDPNEN